MRRSSRARVPEDHLVRLVGCVSVYAGTAAVWWAQEEGETPGWVQGGLPLRRSVRLTRASCARPPVRGASSRPRHTVARPVRGGVGEGAARARVVPASFAPVSVPLLDRTSLTAAPSAAPAQGQALEAGVKCGGGGSQPHGGGGGEDAAAHAAQNCRCGRRRLHGARGSRLSGGAGGAHRADGGVRRHRRAQGAQGGAR